MSISLLPMRELIPPQLCANWWLDPQDCDPHLMRTDRRQDIGLAIGGLCGEEQTPPLLWGSCSGHIAPIFSGEFARSCACLKQISHKGFLRVSFHDLIVFAKAVNPSHQNEVIIPVSFHNLEANGNWYLLFKNLTFRLMINWRHGSVLTKHDIKVEFYRLIEITNESEAFMVEVQRQSLMEQGCWTKPWGTYELQN